MEGSNPLVQEIFSLSDGAVGTVKPIGTEFALPKLSRIIEPVVPPFEEVRTEVEEKYMDDEIQKILDTESIRNLDRLQSGTSMKEISDELGLEIKNTGLIQRDDFLQDVPLFNNIRNAAFSMKVNEYQKVGADEFQVLLKLEKRERPTESEYQEEKAEYTKRALNERREMAYREWLNALRDRAEKKNQIFIDRDLL